MNDWNIQSRAHACQSCGKPFIHKQPYHTLLFDLKQEIKRLDVCAVCWKSEHDEGARDRLGFISHWQGVYEAPAPAPPEAIQKENAESLLRKIMERNDVRYAAASYILAAMLERKRILKVKEQVRPEGQRLFIYEHTKSGDLFTIPDQNLQLNHLDAMEAVQREVALLLEHGLDADPNAISTATASATSPSSTRPEPGARAADPATDPSNEAGDLPNPETSAHSTSSGHATDETALTH